MSIPKLIVASFDVTQIDKKRFKSVVLKSGKRAGQTAVYCDLTLHHTPDSQYGDFIVKQQVTKEEREARVEMPILGNGKILVHGGENKKPAPTAPVEKQEPPPGQDDVPF